MASHDAFERAVCVDPASPERGDQRFVRLQRREAELTRVEATFAEERARSVQTLASPQAAHEAFAEAVGREEARGLVAVADDDAAIARLSARNEDLEIALGREPEDPAPFLVYADWLQAQGDPRGELIALQHGAEARPDLAAAAEAHLKAHRRHLLGPIARLSTDRTLLRWSRGFVRAASFKEYVDHSLLLLPVSLLLAEVVTVRLSPSTCRALADHGGARQVRSLELGTWNEGGEPYSQVFHGDLTALPLAFPALERLILRGTFGPLGLDLPKLRELDFVGSTPPWLEQARALKLERCVLRC